MDGTEWKLHANCSNSYNKRERKIYRQTIVKEGMTFQNTQAHASYTNCINFKSSIRENTFICSNPLQININQKTLNE